MRATGAVLIVADAPKVKETKEKGEEMDVE
jgi:hypothetical protein